MDTETELKAIRYLINDLILYVYDLRLRLDEIVPPRKGGLKLADPNADGNSISFDLFNIPKDKYNALVDKHGIDIINKACNKLDEFIRVNNYVPYGTAVNALVRQFIKEVIKENSIQDELIKKVNKDGKVNE